MPVIQITMSQGRTVEQTRQLVKVLTSETARILDTKEETIKIPILRKHGKFWTLLHMRISSRSTRSGKNLKECVVSILEMEHMKLALLGNIY